ncbi:MAG TPA: hypothetical protein VM779_05225 [Thermoanaerobaculia bacterium]|nr:hypothetical protein [Thermoanaerobaculia bacterium]
MRSLIFFTLAFLLAVTATAQQQQFREERPDYSRDTLLRLFADAPEPPETEPRFQHRFGMAELSAVGTRWRVGYLPFFLPLHGSMPWDHHQRWPDPFVLTGTEIASPPRTWRDQRTMSSELRRIERKLRESQQVEVNPE